MSARPQKTLFVLLAALALCLAPGFSSYGQPIGNTLFMEGDIIFQTEPSKQSLAIRLATNSPYSHCGIIFEKNGQPYVLEAIGPVAFTPLASFVARGINQRYVVMRLKERETMLGPELLAALREQIPVFAGRPYDIYFNWSDDAIYCSELVWKIYQRGGGLLLCEPRPFASYSLNHEQVQKIIEERFGVSLPLSELAVAPADLMQSPLLEEIKMPHP